MNGILNLTQNRILQDLNLIGNKITQIGGYKDKVINSLKALIYLDNLKLTNANKIVDI